MDKSDGKTGSGLDKSTALTQQELDKKKSDERSGTLRLEAYKLYTSRHYENYSDYRKTLITLQLGVIGLSVTLLTIKDFTSHIHSIALLFLCWIISLIGIGAILLAYSFTGLSLNKLAGVMQSVYLEDGDLNNKKKMLTVKKSNKWARIMSWVSGIALVLSVIFFMCFFLVNAQLEGQTNDGQISAPGPGTNNPTPAPSPAKRTNVPTH
jgi:hypothetical protein